MGMGDCMRLKLLILRWIDDCGEGDGDGDGDNGNIPPISFEIAGFWGVRLGDRRGGKFRYEKELTGKGERGEREKKEHTP